MEIRQLRYFVSVARAGSLTKAALDLAIAQPALSKQISLLERELGVPLLVRGSRGVVLTAAGSALAVRAAEVLAKLEQIRHEVQGHRSALFGDVNVGFYSNPSMAKSQLIPLILEFRERHPKVIIHLHENVGPVIEEWVAGGRLDIGIATNISHPRDFTVLPLYKEELLLVFAPDPAASEHTTYAFSDLATLPMILPEGPSHLRRHLEGVSSELGIELRVDLTVNSVGMTKELVKRGAGYTILPRAAVQDEIEAGTLSVATIDDPRVMREVVCITSNARVLSLSAEALRDHIALHWTQSPDVVETGSEELVAPTA